MTKKKIPAFLKHLPPKRALFVLEYIKPDTNGKQFNGTQAAIRAGYSEATAAQQASRLLRNVDILDAVKTAIAQRAEQLQVNAVDVLRQYQLIGFSDLRDFIEWGVRKIEAHREGEKPTEAFTVIIKDSDKLTDDQAAVVKSISLNKDGEVKIELHDKMPALRCIGEHLGMFKLDKITSKELMAQAEAEADAFLKMVQKHVTDPDTANAIRADIERFFTTGEA